MRGREGNGTGCAPCIPNSISFICPLNVSRLDFSDDIAPRDLLTIQFRGKCGPLPFQRSGCKLFEPLFVGQQRVGSRCVQNNRTIRKQFRKLRSIRDHFPLSNERSRIDHGVRLIITSRLKIIVDPVPRDRGNPSQRKTVSLSIDFSPNAVFGVPEGDAGSEARLPLYTSEGSAAPIGDEEEAAQK